MTQPAAGPILDPEVVRLIPGATGTQASQRSFAGGTNDLFFFDTLRGVQDRNGIASSVKYPATAGAFMLDLFALANNYGIQINISWGIDNAPVVAQIVVPASDPVYDTYRVPTQFVFIQIVNTTPATTILLDYTVLLRSQ